MDNKFVELLKSRKFWAAVVGLAVVFLGERAGVEPDKLIDAVYIIVAYILGTSLQSRFG